MNTAETPAERTIQGPAVVPPSVTDPEDRARILKQVTERMKQNPLPVDAPGFTREDLHGRC
jgi:hypothetical protein